MDQIPVEVIGKILSHLREARDIVIASATCHRWRTAWRKHVHTLTFDINNSPIYRRLSATSIEILITETIIRTSGLRSLSILMGGVKFSEVAAITWLTLTKETKETLKELHLKFSRTNINILEKCERKLEVLSIYNSDAIVRPPYQKFPCLKSLSLYRVCIPMSDLSLVIAACPRIELLELVELNLYNHDSDDSDSNSDSDSDSDSESTMKVSSHSLKSINVDTLIVHELIIEADNLEEVWLVNCELVQFELIGNGSLKVLMLDDVDAKHLNIGENTSNLEVVDINNFSVMYSRFYDRIKASSNLKKLRLWRVDFHNQDDILDLGIIPVCFPQLMLLSLDCNTIKHDFLDQARCFKNVMVLELIGTAGPDFQVLVEWLLEKCTNLKTLAFVQFSDGGMNNVTSLMPYMIQLMRKYMQVQVQVSHDIWISPMKKHFNLLRNTSGK